MCYQHIAWLAGQCVKHGRASTWNALIMWTTTRPFASVMSHEGPENPVSTSPGTELPNAR
jgi:hypothetical protein